MAANGPAAGRPHASTTGKASAKTPAATVDAVERVLLDTVHDLVLELHPHRRRGLRVRLDSNLDRDLGLDSLARAELVLRLERGFKVSLPEDLLATSETPADLLQAVQRAGPGKQPRRATAIRHIATEAFDALPREAGTLVDVVNWHVRHHPERPHLVQWSESDEEPTITYGALADAAKRVAVGLRRWGLEPGDRAAIMLPTGPDFFQAFLGILYAGGVPVPIYPPMRMAQLEDHLRRQAGILNSAQAVILITVAEARPVAGILSSLAPDLRGVDSVEGLVAAAPASLPATAAPDRTALLQYTSGSTGDPKGVVLSHDNLLSNIRAMGHAMEVTAADVFVSWLPLYHDMGLIGAWLGSLYHAAPLVIMSPIAFLARPERWLWAIHRHRATLTAAPNFAFELCLRKIDDDDIAGLDLGSLRMVANGAETVIPSTIQRFHERFGRYGFRPEAMAPVYGLAENSVGLTFPPPGRPPIIDRVRRDALTRRGEAVPAAADDPDAVEFVACGRPLVGHQTRIIDATGHEVGERREGRLQWRGPSATSGYFRNPAKTRELYDDGWLDSGDLAYLAEGDLYITGRVKDIIVRAGRNIYPHEVETLVGEIDGIRKGCVALFGSTEPKTGTERIVLMAETRETEDAALAKLREMAAEAATDLLTTPPDEVVLAPPHTVPKTSSGKLRRAAAREIYERGGVGAKPRAVWRQVARLALAGIRPRIRRAVRGLLDFGYASYWWLVMGLMAALVWPLVVLLPRRQWRWSVFGGAARLALRLLGTPLTIAGTGRLKAEGAILVVNHASYLDGMVLAAAIPGGVSFVAKKELAGQLFARLFLARLDTFFVERTDPEGGLEDTRRALAWVEAGGRLLFFAEGTLTRMPGLLPFRLGAFMIAAQAGLPVIPISIRGTRSVLRGEQWFPRRGAVSVTVRAPLCPDGGDFAAAVRLRDAARTEILRQCGEPDLAEEHIIFTAGGIERIEPGESPPPRSRRPDG